MTLGRRSRPPEVQEGFSSHSQQQPIIEMHLGIPLPLIAATLRRYDIQVDEQLTFGALDTILRRLTASARCSFCDLLARDDPDRGIHVANLYLSVLPAMQVLTVLDRLKDEPPETVVWVDVWSRNMHVSGDEVTFVTWSEQTRAIIEAIGRTIVMLSPWNQPLAWQLAWPVLDMFFTMQSRRAKLQFVMYESEDCLQALQHDPIGTMNRLFARLDLRQCSAANQHDAQATVALIDKHVEILQHVIVLAARNCILTLLLREQQYLSTPRLQYAIGLVYLYSGQVDAAEAALNASKAAFQVLYPDPHEATLSVMLCLSVIYRQSSDPIKKQLALTYNQECVTQRKALLGPTHHATVSATIQLSILLIDYDGSRLAEDLLSALRTDCGPDHPLDPEIMLHLGIAYLRKGKTDESVALLLKAYQALSTRHGRNHPDVLTAMYHLAEVYHVSHKYEPAERMIHECYNRRLSLFGKDHALVMSTLARIAYHYDVQDKFNDAIKYYTECWQYYKTKYGEENETVLKFLFNLALVYERSNAPKLAEPLYRQCYEVRSRVLGTEHADTGRALMGLADVLVTLDRVDEAIPMMETCVDLFRRTLGDEHKDTKEAEESLANLYENEDEMEEVEMPAETPVANELVVPFSYLCM